MVRETRYLLVGNLPENVTEDEISEYFKRFSKIQSVKIHAKKENEDYVCATVAFADIKSASKANSTDNSINGKVLTTSYSEGSATGSVVKRTLDEPRPSFSASRPSSYAQRKGPEDGEVYEGRDYYSRAGDLGQYSGYTEEYQRGRPRDRFQGRGGFKQFERGVHHQWTGSQRHFGEAHRSNSSSDRDAFEKPRVPQSPARSSSQASRKSPKMKRKQSNSTSRSRSGSSDSSSSSSYSDSSSDSSRSRSRSGSRSSNRASRSKLPGSHVKTARSRSQGSNASQNTETTEGGNSPHGIKITNLPSRSSDTSLRDGLFHEYKKYGKVNAVQISGNGDGRYAIVSFKKSEDARKARIASQDKRFFGTTIRVTEHEGIDVDDAEFRPPEAELDEHHPKATRTLFVGNLEKEITMEELKDMFTKYGEILDIDVKRQGAISAYSFIQFTDIKSVVKALRALDGETMGGMKLKLGFGKSMPTNCVWVDNLADTVQENFLFRQFARYGPLSNMVIDRERGKALIFFNSLENAQFALNEMRNRILNGQKIQIDFASRDCQTDFYEKMEKSGQLKPGQRSNWNYQRQQSGDGQWVERGRGKFPFVRGGRGFVRGGRGQRWMSGRGYSKDYPDDYRRQRSYDEYSQGGGTPYSEGDFESDLHAYRTQRERQRSCSPDQYSDDMYTESYRDYKSRYTEYGAGSPGSEPDENYEYKSRDEMYHKERFGSREASPEGSYRARSWSHSPTRNRVKDPERNTPPTPLGGDDTQDFSSNEQSPSDMDGKFSDYKRSGKDDFDITEADIQELRTSKYSSAHRKESLSRSEERYSRKRSYEDTFSRDPLTKDEALLRKVDRQLSHGSYEKQSISDSKRDLYQKMKKIQSEISGKMLARTPVKEGEGQASSNSSDSDRGSMTGGDLSKLQHEKQLLIEKLKQLEDAGNSDNEHLDVESGKKSSSKRPRIDPWSGKRLQSELGNVILGPKKDKSYDVSQSYRKQMEAMRKMEEITVKEDTVKTTSKKNDMFSYEEEKEDMSIPQGLLSPKDLPTSFVKKRKKTDSLEENKNRMYRNKRENEDERMSSDNDETAKNVIRTDSITSVGSVRRLSSGHSSPRTPLPGHLSLENIEHRLSESEQSGDLASSLFLKKTDTSKRRSKDEHSSPVIIPLGEDILVTDIPDPRVPKLKSEEEISLPLPKFAEFTPPVKCSSSNSENSGDLSKENSPCFSPPSSGSKNESPQMSPNDTTSEESQTLSNPEPTYIPEENSNEPMIEGSENQEMEVDKPPVDVEAEEALSDSSDHNEDFSLDERIRKLDEKLNQLPITTQSSKVGAENMTTSSIGINISASNPPAKSYSKFKIKKRQDSVGVCAEETEKGDKSSSEIVKTIINRSSIFDLDSKRLEQINEKYSPHSKSVVSNAEDSSNNVTLRTKAEAKEMPLATLPGSLAGRLGNGGSSFPTLSVNTQPTVPLGVKTDDKLVTYLSPNSGKTYSQDQNSQEGQTADMCSYSNDNRIFSLTDRLELQNDVSSTFSPRFNSIDNGVNKTNITSTRTLVESVIESSEKLDNTPPSDSKFNSDPRLRKDLLCKNTDEHLDLDNKKIDTTTQDNKTRKSPPKSIDTWKLDSGVKTDSVCENVVESKSLTNETNHEESNTDLTSAYLGKRKCEINSKKDKVKPSDNNSASINCDSSGHKSDIKSGSESPEPKKVKLSSPEKDKSETNSPNHDSAKSDKHKKDNDKKSKKKEKIEGDSVNKDKGFNDKKDKDHDGDKNKSENNEQSDVKSDKTLKPLPETVKKDLSNKLEGKDGDKSQTKKESDKKSEHSTSKKEKKSDGSSSKKSSGSKTDSLHKKENKSSTESKSKDKTKSSHKTKDLSKGKDDKTDKEAKSHSTKISKSGSTEKVESSKESQNSQQKESASISESDKKDVKTVDNKEAEKTTEIEKSEKSTDPPKVEKSSEVPKEKSKISEKPKDKSSTENKHKTKSDSSKTKSKNVESSKHKPKSEDPHKTKSSHDVTKKSADKTKQKDVTKVKTKSDSTENPKEKATDSKPQTSDKPADSENKTKSESKSAESESGKTAEKVEKMKSLDDTKSKEKSSPNENSKPKEKTGNGAAVKAKDKSEHDKSKSTESNKPKDKTKHSENAHSKSKSKEEKPKQPPTSSHIDKQKSHKDNSKKDDDRSKSDSKKEGGSESKSSSSSKPTSDNSTASEKKEESNHDNKSENKSEKSENKNDGKTDNSSENTDSLAKNKSDCKKERKKSGESKSSKSSSKRSSSEKKSETKSVDKKNPKKHEKEIKKEEKTSPKDKNKKQEVEFDWSAWMDEPYVSMYDRVKRKSSEKDREREMQEMKNKFNSFAKSRNKKHSKLSETEESDFSHDSDEETDAFEEEKVAKPSKEVSSVHESGTKRKRCVISTSTSSDDDDSQLFKSFQKSTLDKEKSKSATGKFNKHSVNDIYSSDSSETDIDFPPISPAKKKTKKTKKAKKPQIHHDSDSEYDKTPDKQKKKKNMSGKPKPKSTPKKKSDIKTPPNHSSNHSNLDTHESDLYDIDSDMDIFDRIKLKNQKKNNAQKVPTKGSAKKLLDTTTDDSDNPMLSPSRKANIKKPELKPIKKSILSDPSLFDTDSDSSFPDLSTVTSKNCITKKINHEINKPKKPIVTVGAGVIAQTIRNEDIGQKNDLDIKKNDLDVKKKEKIKKKSKKNDVIKSDDAMKKCGEDGKGLFEKIENFMFHSDTKEKDKISVKHSKKEGKSQNHKNMGYLDEEEISQAEKLVNNMNKLEKPTKHESTKSNKIVKPDQDKTKSKTKKIEHSLSSETDTDKEAKSHNNLYHENKAVGDGKKDKDGKKTDDAKSKTKKKKHDVTSVESTQKPSVEVARKVNDMDLSKKSSNKIEMEDVLKKQTNKKEIDDGCMKKVTSKLEMDNGPFKNKSNKIEKDEGYKIGFGFFEDFPLLENEKNYSDNGLKRGKKKKDKKEDDEKNMKKDSKEGIIKSDEKTPKKKERKKKDVLSEMNVKENGPKLEELVGRLAKSAQNDVFDFQEEEEDDKPLFAEFFKVKEEMAKKAAAKQDKPDGKKSTENKLSSEEKSDDASSESHEETEAGLKNDLKKLQKSATAKIVEHDKTESKQESEKIEESIKSSLFSPSSDDGKIEDPSISSIFSPKHVKEACKDEAKNIMAFASPKGIEMGKSDDECSKSSVISPVKVGMNPKGKGMQDLVVCQAEMELKEDRLKKTTDSTLKDISLAEKKWGGIMALKEDTSKKEKSNIISDVQKTKSALDADKNDHHFTYSKQTKKGKAKVSDKPEVPEKSREEIMLEAVSSLEKLSENTSVVTPEPDNYPEGELVIDETTAAVETVSEEPELTEQAQNETDLAILSILPLDEKSSSFVEPLQPPLVDSQPVVAPENVVIETEQITLESNARDTSLEQNDLVIDTAAPQTNENHKDNVLPAQQKSLDLLENQKDVHLPVPAPVPKTAELSVTTKEMPPTTIGPFSHVVDSVPEPVGETPSLMVPVEKSVQQKQQKSRRHQKPKENVKVQNEPKDVEVPSGQVLKTAQPPVMPTDQAPVIPNMQGQMFSLTPDPKYAGLPKPVPDIQKPEPYRKTRKQKANAKANHQVEVPGTFYPPVYNAIDHGFHLQNNLQGGDASEKENEEKLSQSYDQDKHDDGDNLRISGDEGSNSTDKRSRRGRKAQNYKELNSGVLGRTTSPRSRTSPRSPRAGMSPRQALSPLSSPKSEMSTPVVKIERLPFGCNKNIRMDSDVSNDAMGESKQQITEVIENHNDHQGFASTKKMVEEISKAPLVSNPVKDATNVFDFDDNEPELKIDTTPLKATRTKKGRRSTQDSKITNTEVKNTIGSPNHIVSPLESRWQCKKDSESEKGGNHPLKLTIALAHSTMSSTSATNSTTSVINSATIIDSTIPSIKGKKDVESIPKVSSAAITVTTTVTTMTASTLPKPLCKSNVDRIIDDVSKGIFDWAATTGIPPEHNKDHLLANITGISPKMMENQTVAPQPTKKRHAGARGHNGEQEMMPPPMVSPPGHDLVQTKPSPVMTPSAVSLPFGTSVVTTTHGRPPLQTTPSPVMTLSGRPPLQSTPSLVTTSIGRQSIQTMPLSVTTSVGRPPLQTTPSSVTSALVSSQGQIGEPPVISYSQTKSSPQITKSKPLDMALNMTSRAELMSPAHSLSTAAVVTTTTTTTVAQQNPGTSVVMSAQRPTVTNSGNTTVLAGRTVTVKPPNTEAYLQQMGLHPGSIPSHAPFSAHQPTMPRISEGKQGFPHGFMPGQTFSRPEVHPEHSKPVSAVASSEKQPQVTSSAPTCVVHPITSASGKTAVDAKLLHQQMMQAVSSRAQTIPTSSQHIPPAHMQPTQAQLMEKDQQLRTMHGQPPMMHLMGQPPHVMPNHIQHKSEKSGKTKKAEMPQPNEPMQRPPSAHSQKSTNEPQRPLSAHENQALFQEQIRNLVGKGFIPPGAIPPQILQMYHHQQQLAAAAKIEDKKGHKGHPPKEMVSPGIAHQPPSMFAASIASQSSNPQIKSPAVAQTAPSPHSVFSQPSTSQARPNSPGLKKMNQNHWPNESPVDARNEAQRSRPTSVEPAPSPKHWAYSGNQQPKPAHQQNMDSNSKAHLEAVRLVEQHKQQEMLRLQQEKQDRAKLQEIQRQEIQRREEIIRQQALKSRDNVPPTSASTSQQSDRDRQTASVPGKPRSSHIPNNTESGLSVMDPRSLHHLSELRGPRGQSAFASPSGEMIQGIPAHLYRDPEFQQRLHAAAALRMPHLLDPHLIPQGYPLGLPHPYLGQVGTLPMDHPHIPDGRPPSQGGSHGMRTPPPRQAHQAVMKSPAIPGQSRQIPDPPPGEGSLLSLLQRYPVMWQGTLALKNDSCAVQMHVISGYNALVQTALPQQIVEGTCQPLRIAQRMRLEAAQLEGVVKRMQYDNDYCMLLALPCGSDHDDIIYQTRAMSTGFIQYLQQKQAAGIVNVADPGSQQPAYVVHIFPPCEFSHETLGRLGFELLHQVRNLSHLLVIITTVA